MCIITNKRYINYFQMCIAEKQDWRQCQNEVKDFRSCMDEYTKRKFQSSK